MPRLSWPNLSKPAEIREPSMDQQEMNVTEFLIAGKAPEQVALHALDRSYTYGELIRATAAVAAYLRPWSGATGERVILAADNSFFWVASYLGILRAGLVCVPLPATASTEDLAYILEVTEARIVFADGAFALKHGPLLRGRHLVTDRQVVSVPDVASRQSFEDLCAGSGDYAGLLPPVHGDHLAALVFTSGSTGKPRGVMVSHANIVANTASIIQYLDLTAGDRMMCVLPFHYCFGASLLHTHLRVGGSLVLESRFMYPELVLQRMIETECTGFAGVPSHFQILLRRSSLREKHFPCLRHVQQAGGHLAPGMVRELCESLPGTRVFVMYGQTEATARLSYVPPELLETKLGSIGKGIPGVRLAVLNEAGLQVRPGEVGEIVAEGDNVTQGYWRAPLESAVSFRQGKLHTGDLARIDEEGFIYIVGRAKDFLKCGGKRVSCRQLEEQILGYEGVLEAAVIGVPDEILGDAVKLFIVPRDGAGGGFAQRVRLFCKERLPLPLVPREIVVMPALPKNAAGKVLKEQLKEPVMHAACEVGR
jgi:acyl-CoA synthetase (AMP-forming)/AMP-acid ligase II